MAQSKKLFYKTLIFMPNYLRKITNFKIEVKKIRILVYLKDTAGIETRMAEKSSPGTRQTVGKNLVWFGEIERKLAKLSMPTFAYHSSS